ncbi:hypothetical protein RND71_033245 [Anisodus tanguticus]|uniref:Uncharacterized protein n=1 Tax=Anisodus tanguticus TaxID=243964 RepID=A0AAE1R838_9SOLA|nr:hypothetical protein RND71_033245 [Anisodus tanguticus]
MMQRPRRRCEGTAMGSIVLDLRPGVGIGPFTLGSPISEAFGQIEQQPNIYDVVHVKYYDEDPLKLDIVISFPDHGFHLRFDPWSQGEFIFSMERIKGIMKRKIDYRKYIEFIEGKAITSDFDLMCGAGRLRLIEIFDVKRLQMRYATSVIGGPSTLATFVAVYTLFGPTYPGTYDKDRGVYTLFYPGLSFSFPIPSQYTDCCRDGEAELPLEFPDGTTPVTCRVSIYDSSAGSKVGVGSMMDKACTPPLPAGSLYMEEVHVKCINSKFRSSSFELQLLVVFRGESSLGSLFDRRTVRLASYFCVAFPVIWPLKKEIDLWNFTVLAVLSPPAMATIFELGEELRFSIGGQHIPFGASPQSGFHPIIVSLLLKMKFRNGLQCRRCLDRIRSTMRNPSETGFYMLDFFWRLTSSAIQVDQMVIHSASDPRPRTTLCGDYFYNYFTRGLDILFDGQTHKIKKFVLHTNYPGHADFNSYMKCNFVIHCSDFAGSYHQDVNSSKATITANTKWEQVKEILGDCGRAAIQTQGSTSNPFGSTFVYGYQNLAFEVMKNGYIATVTLFQS